MKNKINKDLISNIEISDDMKKALYTNCIKGRRTADFAFKYSGLLSILIFVGVFTVTGIGASAAILGVKARLENMSEEEYEDYQIEVDNDIFNATNEGESRELTDAEIRKIIKLERKYYDDGVFPENEMPHLNTKSELKDGELAYVIEDNLVYFPEKDMNDEQILQYIDHNAKKRYVNIQGLLAEGIEPGVNMAMESTPVAQGSNDSKAKEAAIKLVKENFGKDIDDSWIVLLDYFEDDMLPNGRELNTYNINIYQLGVGYATEYTIRLDGSDYSPVFMTQNGYLEENDAKHYSKDEAENKADEGEEKMSEMLSQKFGYGVPKNVRKDIYVEYYEDNKTPYIEYTFEYDDENVWVQYRIEDGAMTGFGIE